MGTLWACTQEERPWMKQVMSACVQVACGWMERIAIWGCTLKGGEAVSERLLSGKEAMSGCECTCMRRGCAWASLHSAGVGMHSVPCVFHNDALARAPDSQFVTLATLPEDAHGMQQ
eukprot:scaffold143402_cov18-Tisochrysis_lutea.AAC.1